MINAGSGYSEISSAIDEDAAGFKENRAQYLLYK